MSKSIALVTGGSRGIGRAVVQRLIADGFEVVNFSRTAPDQILKGESFESVDLSNPTLAREAVADLVSKKQVLNLVNNAGMVHIANLEDVTIDQIADMNALNFVAPIIVLQGLLPGMKAAKYGRVVNLGSRASLGKEGRSIYGGLKAGLAGMTRTWALELGPYGITVNTIAPGPIATEMFNANNPPGAPRTNKIIEGIPVKRIGLPEDIAHMTASLIDARAGFLTGQTIHVCGGLTVGNSG
jgi:NAD(P)-dependent dehydrogenase (short-subunit alcohol dehydrogenase family)